MRRKFKYTRKNYSVLKMNHFIRYIKTEKKKYIINLFFSGLISFVVAYVLYSNSGKQLDLLVFVVFAFLFYNCYRAGEYLLTGKIISVDRTFFFGYEERGNTAKKSFLYYLLTATIFAAIVIYLSLKYSY